MILMPCSLREAIVLKIVVAVSEAISSTDLDAGTREEIRRAAESYSDGVSAGTVDRVVTAVNKLVNIPLVEENVERAIIRQVLNARQAPGGWRELMAAHPDPPVASRTRQVVSLMLGDAGPLHLVGATVQQRAQEEPLQPPRRTNRNACPRRTVATARLPPSAPRSIAAVP